MKELKVIWEDKYFSINTDDELNKANFGEFGVQCGYDSNWYIEVDDDEWNEITTENNLNPDDEEDIDDIDVLVYDVLRERFVNEFKEYWEDAIIELQGIKLIFANDDDIEIIK